MHTPHAVTVLNTRRDGSVVHLVMGVVPAENMLSLTADATGGHAADRHPRVVEAGR